MFANASDVPIVNGHVSDALILRLAQQDLLDLGLLLKYRGVRTVRALDALDTNERSVLLVKSRQLYELLGFFPSNLHKAMDLLFANGEACVLGIGGVLSSYPSPLQPGTVGSQASVASGPAFVNPQWRNGVSSSSHSRCSEVSCPPGLVPVGAVHPAQAPGLPETQDDDTLIRKGMIDALQGARHIMGEERYKVVVKSLVRSDELSLAGCMEVAEADAALNISKDEVGDRQKWLLLKVAKKSIRDFLLWRCTGHALGMDQRTAFDRSVQLAVRYANCDENIVSQMSNGFRRVKEELAGGPPAKKRVAACSRDRSRIAGRQQAAAIKETESPRGASSVVDGTQPAQAAVAKESAQGWSPMSPPFSECTNSLAVGSRVGVAPGSRMQHLPATHRDRSFSRQTARSLRPCSFPPRIRADTQPQCTHGTVDVVKASDSGIEPTKAHGRLEVVVATAVLQELQSSIFIYHIYILRITWACYI